MLKNKESASDVIQNEKDLEQVTGGSDALEKIDEHISTIMGEMSDTSLSTVVLRPKKNQQ